MADQPDPDDLERAIDDVDRVLEYFKNCTASERAGDEWVKGWRDRQGPTFTHFDLSSYVPEMIAEALWSESVDALAPELLDSLAFRKAIRDACARARDGDATLLLAVVDALAPARLRGRPGLKPAPASSQDQDEVTRSGFEAFKFDVKRLAASARGLKKASQRDAPTAATVREALLQIYPIAGTPPEIHEGFLRYFRHQTEAALAHLKGETLHRAAIKGWAASIGRTREQAMEDLRQARERVRARARPPQKKKRRNPRVVRPPG